MKKALVIPKIAAGVVCLLIAMILSFPVLPVMSNKLFGGGTMDFNSAKYDEYRVNRPVDGTIFYVLGASEGVSESGGALTNGNYYYLVPAGGKMIDNLNKVDTLVLVKAVNGSDVYTSLNDLYRVSASGNDEKGFELTGVLRNTSADEKSTAEKLKAATPYSGLAVSEYTLDLTKPVKGMTARFAISLIFSALTIGCIVLVFQAINKNAELEDIEDKRMAFRIEQEKKSGNTNDDGSDKMYGNSDASYGVKPPKNDGSESGGHSAGGGYKPSFQSQGGEEYTPPTKYDDSQEDGFFGSNAAPGNAGFFGGSQQGAQYPPSAPAQNSPFDDSLYGGSGGQGAGQSGGFYGGSGRQSASPFDDSLYGGASGNGGDDDDMGFFGGR